MKTFEKSLILKRCLKTFFTQGGYFWLFEFVIDSIRNTVHKYKKTYLAFFPK